MIITVQHARAVFRVGFMCVIALMRRAALLRSVNIIQLHISDSQSVCCKLCFAITYTQTLPFSFAGSLLLIPPIMNSASAVLVYICVYLYIYMYIIYWQDHMCWSHECKSNLLLPMMNIIYTQCRTCFPLSNTHRLPSSSSSFLPPPHDIDSSNNQMSSFFLLFFLLSFLQCPLHRHCSMAATTACAMPPLRKTRSYKEQVLASITENI